jgi:hypothetical protein
VIVLKYTLFFILSIYFPPHPFADQSGTTSPYQPRNFFGLTRHRRPYHGTKVPSASSSRIFPSSLHIILLHVYTVSQQLHCRQSSLPSTPLLPLYRRWSDISTSQHSQLPSHSYNLAVASQYR